MGSFFELAFPDVSFNTEGETQVCCPFPHYTSSGEIYHETNPSAGVNLVKRVFHCFSCKASLSEIGFIAKYMNINYAQASRFKTILDNSNETINDWTVAQQALLANNNMMEKLTGELHIPLETINELKLGYEGTGICFPVFVFGKLINVTTYNKGMKPKYRQREGHPTKMIIPYDDWRVSAKSTLICAGEKDMAIARSFGFNAITITGGEGTLPELFRNDFKGRTVYIIYDNDSTGIDGARKVATFLRPVTEKIKIIDLSSVCVEKGEDLWDYFNKYNKTKADLVNLIKDASWFTEEDYQNETEKTCPTVSLIEGTSNKFVGRIVRSNVQIIATVETQFLLPSSITGTKSTEIIPNSKEIENLMAPGEVRSWYLGDSNIGDIMYLIDSSLKEDKIYAHKRSLLGIPKKEVGVTIKDTSKETVFKCVVTDVFESIEDTNIQRTEYIAYSINRKLDNGKKYRITYKLVPHPFDGQKLIMIILDVENSNDSVNNFKVTAEKINLLKQFHLGNNLEENINILVEKAKGLIGEDRNNELIKLIDFWYHTPLRFNLGRLKDIRAYIELLIIGESRLGKSTTAKALLQTYKLGSIVNFGGSAITTAGLIGGANKVNGAFQTRAGLIPQNNEGAMIFEELSRCENNLLKQLTEVRSSNEVKLARVDGEIRLPAWVRMLSLSNTKESGGNPRPMTSYPNGISIITDLIESAADIARYDIIACIYDSAAVEIDPFWQPQEPLSIEAYQTRIRWIWSRKADQINISQEVYQHLIHLANELNHKYDTHIKIFGIETWKKIVRLSIAIAGYVVSTNDKFDEIVVKKEHIDYAVKMFVNLYDNQNFRFKQFVDEENKLRNILPEELPLLQQLYEKNPTVLLHLESYSETSRNNLNAIAGMDSESFSKFMQELVAYSFIRFEGYNIIPTEKFRKGMTHINREIRVRRVEEITLNVTN